MILSVYHPPMHASVTYIPGEGRSLYIVLGMLDPSQIPLLNSLKRQRSYESCTYTRPILCRQDLNGVLLLRRLLLRPVQDLPQGNSTTGFEMRVLVEDRSVSTDVACLIAFLLAYCSNATSREAGGSGSNEFG